MTDLPAYPEEAAQREEAQVLTTAAERRYSGWWRRVGAYLLDIVIIFVPLTIVIALFAWAEIWAVVVIAYIALIVLPFAYFTYFHGSSGRTPGKSALGIRVVSEDSGDPISYGRAFGRYGITVVFSFVFIPWVLDYLWPLWDSKNQSLHDKVVSSVVVRGR